MSDSLRDTFFAECEDLLDSLTEGLSLIEDGDEDLETINAIFRAVHSIKGAAGAFALEDLVAFAHKYETVLDLIRSQSLEIDQQVLHLITRSADCLADLVDRAREASDDLPESLEKLTESLAEVAGAQPEPDEAKQEEEEFVFEALPFAPLDLEPIAREAHYVISFAPVAAMYRNGHDPVHIFLELAGLGDLTVKCDTSQIPTLASFDPDESYLSWELDLKGDIALGQIRDVFAFVDGLCDLNISDETPLEDQIPTAIPTIEGESITDFSEPKEAEKKIVAESPSTIKEGNGGSDKKSLQSKGDTERQSAQAKPKAASAPTLRVDPERVDRLINTVGELIINQAVIAQKLHASGVTVNSDLDAELDDYRYLAREIQEGVMAIRAQPVKPLFQRMGRVVREAADSTSKSVQLVTEGEYTEIDKTLVERLADPLTHIVRNAIDHGIEAPDQRKRDGKPEQGTVKLSAAHRSGHVQIEISDDGAGINRERVFSIAVDKGLIPPDTKLTDAEVDNLLFLPGFSTAKEVTNLSGRGVGMDVVKTTIQSIGGRVAITSEPGQGSLISISLPLTLAVMDGMIVRAGDETLILPLSSIVETIRPKLSDIMPIGQNGHVLAVRGAYVPIVNLQEALRLGSDNDASSKEAAVFALIQVEGAESIALGVDAILDQRQIVIKSLEGNYGIIPGISAATILGDGQIALIVDTDSVVRMAGQNYSPKELPPQQTESGYGQQSSLE